MRIKIVPKEEPNADGQWIEVDAFVSPNARGWNAIAAALVPAVPETHFLVAYELDDGTSGEK